jgi:hypothetical protein
LRVFARARDAGGAAYTSDALSVPRGGAGGAGVAALQSSTPGACAFVSDNFFDGQEEETPIVVPSAINPKTLQSISANGSSKAAAAGVKAFRGKAPDAFDGQEASQRMCGSVSYTYKAEFGPFSSTACGTYTVGLGGLATPLVRRRRQCGAHCAS